MKIIGEVWLVYRPAHGYEESITPYFVCATEDEARACAEKMNAFLLRVAKRLPVVDFELEDEVWVAANRKREALLAKIRWPFGISLEYDLSDAESLTIVQVMELEFRGLR